MTLLRKLSMIAAVALCATVTAIEPGRAAERLPADTAEALGTAAKSRDSAAFRAALRRAIAAAPDRKAAILRYAMVAHPAKSADLLMASLYDPPPRDSSAQAIAVALTRRQSEQTAVAPPGESPEIDEQSAEAIEETGPWNGSILLGATVRTGNTDNAGATGQATVGYEEGRWHHLAKASADYLRNRAETQEQAFEGEYEARYDLDARTFSFGLGRYEEDRFSGFEYEVTSSAGLGRHLVKEEGHEWTVTLGPSLRVAQPAESEDLDRAFGARFTNLLSWELSDSAKLENETEALADQDRVRVDNDVVLKLRIVDELSAQLSFGLEYRSDAPEKTEHVDTTTRAAVVYDF